MRHLRAKTPQAAMAAGNIPNFMIFHSRNL
jgi:hypothetical protein